MRPFRAILAQDATETAEGFLRRVFPEGCFDWRELPLTMRGTVEDQGAHYGAFPLGRIDTITMDGNLVVATGELDDEGEGADADRRRDLIRQIENGTLNGISVDPGALDVAEEMECTSTDADGFCEESVYVVTFTRYQIAAATVVAIPALEGTMIELDPAPAGEDAAAEEGMTAEVAAVTAAAMAAAADLDTIPAEWLTEPADLPAIDGPNGRVPQITADGRVFGYLASWQDCHVAFTDRCQTPWHSMSGYAYALHCGPFPCTDGETRRLAPLAVQGGHYPTQGTNPNTGERYAREWQAAQAHYDDPTACAAYVAVGENEHGIWYSGALRQGVTDEQIGLLRRHQLSGDWRRPGSDMELVGMCSVNFPGFIRQVAVSASASGEFDIEAALIGGNRGAVAASAMPCCDECAAGNPCAASASAGHSHGGEDDIDGRLARLEQGLGKVLAALEPQRREQLRAKLTV